MNHRDYLSHYGEVKFWNPDLQKFFDEKRQYSDPKSLIIWQARKSIMDKLLELGSDRPTKYPLYLTVLTGMTEMIDCAIQYSLNDGIPRAPLADLKKNLIDYFSKYQQAVASAPLFEPKA